MEILDRRPILVALAGPNGAGKSSFYRAYLRDSGLRFVNADVVAKELQLDPYRAAEVADGIRRELIGLGESFIFETVFSDPVGDKLNFMVDAERAGYTTVLLFIGLSSPELSDQRVAIRVSQGGHDVPAEKVMQRFPRTMENLKNAMVSLKNIYVYDNSELGHSHRLVAKMVEGDEIVLYPPIPGWLKPLLPAPVP
jgi:predicted ABC-type ATPase